MPSMYGPSVETTNGRHGFSSNRPVIAIPAPLRRGRREFPIVKKPHWRIATAVGIVTVAIVASAVGASAHSTKATVGAGGTVHVGWGSSVGFTDNGDPTGEYLGDWFGVSDNLLVRTLVGYTHQPDAAGNKVVPDIVTSVPTPTNGGKKYTYHLKAGIKFSPPVNRAVTSQDFVTAMNRLANPKDGGQYSFYYKVIKGWDAYAAGKAKSISGISTPKTRRSWFTSPVRAANSNFGTR